MSDKALQTVIVDGVGKMAGFEDTLSREEIELLIEQIRSFSVERDDSRPD